MKRPAIMFYVSDWRANAKLGRCTFEERGIWIEAMCLLHDSEEYGLLRWPLKDIAQAIGCRVTQLRRLQAKGVLKGADTGEQCEAYVFTPRHAGKDGEPVTLVKAQPGPIWYSSRMVRDEHIRLKRGLGSRFGEAPKQEPKPTFGDGPSVAVSFSDSKEEKAAANADADASCSAKGFIYREALAELKAQGVSEAQARALLGRLVKLRGEEEAAALLRQAVADGRASLQSYIGALLRGPTKRQAADADLSSRDYSAGLPTVREAA